MAGWAAERATDADLSLIGRHLEQMKESDNPNAFLEADLNFHLAIGNAAHNAIFMNALHLIRNLLRQWIGRTLGVGGVTDLALQQHQEIFEAIQRRDASAARGAMQRHLNDMARYLLAIEQGAAAESIAAN